MLTIYQQLPTSIFLIPRPPKALQQNSNNNRNQNVTIKY